MKNLIAAITLFALTCAAMAADQAPGDFTGHYELVKNSKSAFALDVQLKGRTASASFSAAHEDGSGAAPDGDCKGQLNDKGELKLDWTDSFDNAGTAVLRRDGKLFRLSMKTTKVTESRALVFYGEVALKRTSTRPQSNAR